MFFNIQPGWKRRPLRNDESSCSGDAATTEARSWGSSVLISCCFCFLSICFKVSGTSWYVGMCREIYKSFGHLGSWEFLFRSFLPRWWEMVSINHYEVATCGTSVLSVKCTSSLRPKPHTENYGAEKWLLDLFRNLLILALFRVISGTVTYCNNFSKYHGFIICCFGMW